MAPITRRAFLGAGGALVVGIGLGRPSLRSAGAQQGPVSVWPSDRYLGKTVAPGEVDAYLAIHADESVTVFTGKVDLGTGGRAAMRQMVAEELDIDIERITELIEGDTAVCPDQGGTGGSTGISRGGQELRRQRDRFELHAALAQRNLVALRGTEAHADLAIEAPDHGGAGMGLIAVADIAPHAAAPQQRRRMDRAGADDHAAARAEAKFPDRAARLARQAHAAHEAGAARQCWLNCSIEAVLCMRTNSATLVTNAAPASLGGTS